MSLLQRSGTLVVDIQGRVRYIHPSTIPAAIDQAALMSALEPVA